MKRLLVDTGVALDLVVLELASISPQGAYRHLASKATRLRTAIQRDFFLDKIRDEFGIFAFTTGVMVELDRHAASAMRGHRHGNVELLSAFWAAVDSVFGRFRVGRSLEFPGFAWPPTSHNEVVRWGLVDAHLLTMARSSQDNWLTTIDGELEAAVADMADGRFVRVD